MKTPSTQTAEAGTVAGRVDLKFRLHPSKHKKSATRKTLGVRTAINAWQVAERMRRVYRTGRARVETLTPSMRRPVEVKAYFAFFFL
jgi:hypothetical protein